MIGIILRSALKAGGIVYKIIKEILKGTQEVGNDEEVPENKINEVEREIYSYLNTSMENNPEIENIIKKYPNIFKNETEINNPFNSEARSAKIELNNVIRKKVEVLAINKLREHGIKANASLQSIFNK